MSKFDRRDILKLIGLGAVGHAALPWLRSASAQSGEIPLRLLFVELGHGARRGTWEPTVAGPTDPEATQVVDDWAFQPLMEALAPYRSRLNMFQNLDMVSHAVDPTGPADAHTGGQTHMLTAADRLTDQLSGGVSIDQYIASALSEGGLLTRLRSLELGAREHSEGYSDVFYHHAYATPGEKLPFLSHIPNIWAHLFSEPLPMDDAAQMRANQKRTSVFNFVKSDYERLAGRLPQGDREKLESMLAARDSLQRSLTVINNRAALRPSESVIDPWRSLDEGYMKGTSDNRLWDTKADIVNQLVGAALHTDTTRVVNYVLELPPDYEAGYSAGTTYDGVQTTDWHDLAHKVSGDNPELSNPEAQQVMYNFEKRTYDKLASLLAHLDSLQETDGRSLLEHTLVVVHSHIAEGSHDVTRLPWLLIGDAQGKLSTGHYVRFPIRHRENPNQIGRLEYPLHAAERIYNFRGRPHNDLFVTIARAMGLELESFGRQLPECRGVIEEILA